MVSGAIVFSGLSVGDIDQWNLPTHQFNPSTLIGVVSLFMAFVFFLFFFQLFIKSNQGDEETTKINYLTFIGTPVQATNMNDFKRVRRHYSHQSIFMFIFMFIHIKLILLCCRLWGRKERVTEQQKEENMRRSQIHPRTFTLPKLPHAYRHTHIHTRSPAVLPELSMYSLSLESTNHLYCNTDENHCK